MIVIFGSELLALTEDGRHMFAWDTAGGGKPQDISITPVGSITCSTTIVDVQSTIQFDPGFTATLVLHPATYLNKVLVASNQGDMQLWNIRTKLVACRALSVYLCHKFTGLAFINFPARVSSPLLAKRTQQQ
jgi:U3 small nucleolar RNA-associated protein 21